jgi:Co/Zn/Cd efflux system component
MRVMTGWVNGNAAPIDGKLMMIIACVGVVFNIVSGPVAP